MNTKFTNECESEKSMIYPRVLIFSSSNFNLYTGTGILLTNLFRGWHISNIAIIHNDDFPNDESLCKNSYKLSLRDYAFHLPFLAKTQKEASGKSEKFGEEDANNIMKKVSANFIPKVKLRKVYDKINDILGGREVYSKHIISDPLKDWITQYNPQILYCHVSSLMNVRFVSELQKLLEIPLCIHIMDDWFNVRYSKGIFASKLKADFHKEFNVLLQQTSLRMGIGGKMCNAYEKKFNYSFEPFSNAIDPAFWLKRSDKSKTNSGKFRIVYAGTINNKNINNLKVLSEIVEQINNEKNNCELEIRTFNPRVEQYRAELERIPSVTIEEVPSDDENMMSLLKCADLLFLPVDFTNVSIERMRYSIFAKLPAYMMSGTPVLVYGPQEVASIEYAMKEQWAYVVANQDKKALKEAVVELISNPILREELGKRAQEIGKRDFNVNYVREQFSTKLAETAFSKDFSIPFGNIYNNKD